MRHLRRRLAVAVVALLGPGLVAAPADAAQSWQRYVVAPDSRDVRPVRVVETTGDVTHPQGVLGHGTAVLRRSPAPAKPAWPAGTTATASSFHAPNNGNDGKPRTYAPGNAIDGDTGTFWNDDTLAAYPDTLTITTPATNLPGITLQSSPDGVPQDFTVETWDGTAWHTAATVTGNTRTQLAVPFDKPATTTQVRLTVTKDQATDKGEFTRVNEIWPGLVADPPVPSVVVDFGKVVVGYPRISFAGASANNPGVRLAFSESRQYLTDRSDFTRSDFSGGPGTDQHAVPGGRSQWTDTKGCLPDGKVCSDGLHGFRYVRISLDALPGDAPDAQPYGEVRIDGVSLLFSAFLGTPDTYNSFHNEVGSLR
ncbi:discoidin domain-containing protein [Amycolatopsis dongchuanensis]|uniref:F5/8 type C domain-containing protein n=1 Tax=Amycolatopsis dongchuanensis TaxID=1070866 RepID=A0ABP8VIH8_9PSEU